MHPCTNFNGTIHDPKCKSGAKDKGLASFGATINYPARLVRGANLKDKVLKMLACSLSISGSTTPDHRGLGIARIKTNPHKTDT
jgi:hypothetical protein